MATITYSVFFTNAGVPEIGLTPTAITFKKVSDGTNIALPSVSETGGGWYKFSATFTESAVIVIDGGAGLADADRYKASRLEITDDISPYPASDVAALILDDPNNLLVTNSDGAVQLPQGNWTR